MNTSWWKWIRGSVVVTCRGKDLEALLNALISEHIEIWNVRKSHDGRTLEFGLSLPDFFRLRPLLKKTSCRMHVKERYGFPFFLVHLERRKAFVAGIGVCLGLIWVLSSLVWNVEIQGNEQLTREEIVQAAEEVGIKPLQWKFRLREPQELSAALTKKLEGVSWVGVHIDGSKIAIEVVESVIPEEKPLYSPRHLIADHDAVVSRSLVESGRPMVRPNQRVRKGDVLISGLLGDEENQKLVVSKGEVWGWVWHEVETEVPLIHKKRVFTGNRNERFYLVFGSRGLKLKGYGQEEFTKSETEQDRYALQIGDYTLPIGWLKETERESRFQETFISLDDAKKIGLLQARKRILEQAGEGATINGEKIVLADRDENKLHLKIWFEVEQEITKEQVLVKNQ